MNEDTMTGLTLSSDPIAGIYNYCDRWCRYCTRKAHCLAYAAECFPEGTPPVASEALVNHLSGGMEIARDLLGSYREVTGTLVETETGSVAESGAGSCHDHPLFLSAGAYLGRTNSVLERLPAALKVFSGNEYPGSELESAVEIIRWYQYHIGAKLLRALHALHSPLDEAAPAENPDCSAKIALIGIERSMAAWGILSSLRPEFRDEATEVVFLLDQLRLKAEKEFPSARSFPRPGFDDI
jgi:hypothetical protein